MKKILFLFGLVTFLGAGCISASDSNTSSTNSMADINHAVTLSGLTFTLPSDWKVETTAATVAKISVPDPTYQVLIPMEVKEYSPTEAARLRLSRLTALNETSSGAKIYEEVCAPALECDYVVLKDKTYLITFAEPESDQPVPTDLDGVWFPSTTVTNDELMQVILSVR